VATVSDIDCDDVFEAGDSIGNLKSLSVVLDLLIVTDYITVMINEIHR
jgi:hypothetical protein